MNKWEEVKVISASLFFRLGTQFYEMRCPSCKKYCYEAKNYGRIGYVYCPYCGEKVGKKNDET